MSRLKHHSPKAGENSFSPAYHLEMVTDRRRVLPLLEAIDRAADGCNVFLELGCGSGIFSKYAAMKFKRVITVEKDPIMHAIAKANLANEIERGIVTLLNCDAIEIASSIIGEAEVVFCEMMSTWLLVEPQIPVLRHIRDCLGKKKIRVIPSNIQSTIELVHANFEPFGVSIRAHYTEFTGIVPAEAISLPVCAWKIDFAHDELTSVREGNTAVGALLSGVANAVRLRSYVQVFDGVPFSGSDTLMPPTVIPLTETLSIEAGECVQVSWKVTHSSPLERVLFSVARLQT